MYQIYLDMDEVVTDFTGAACRLFSVSVKDLTRCRDLGSWEIITGLSKATGKHLTNSILWKEIQKDEYNFWANVDPLPWADDILNLVREVDPNFMLMSTPSLNPMCWAGKTQWIKDNYPRYNRQLCLTDHKDRFAGEYKILIDDKESTIEKFEVNGGYGILFPSLGNRLHKFASDPVPYVARELKKIYGD